MFVPVFCMEGDAVGSKGPDLILHENAGQQIVSDHAYQKGFDCEQNRGWLRCREY